MTNPDPADDHEVVAQRHRDWTFNQDKSPQDPSFVFADAFADFYDFTGGEAILYDDLAPGQRTALSAHDYGAMIEPLFNALAQAEHAIEFGPSVLVSGRVAATHLVFIARLTAPEGAVSGIRTRLVMSHVGGDWRIVREHNSSTCLEAAELDALMLSLPTAGD